MQWFVKCVQVFSAFPSFGFYISHLDFLGRSCSHFLSQDNLFFFFKDISQNLKENTEISVVFVSSHLSVIRFLFLPSHIWHFAWFCFVSENSGIILHYLFYIYKKFSLMCDFHHLLLKNSLSMLIFLLWYLLGYDSDHTVTGTGMVPRLHSFIHLFNNHLQELTGMKMLGDVSVKWVSVLLSWHLFSTERYRKIYILYIYNFSKL